MLPCGGQQKKIYPLIWFSRGVTTYVACLEQE